MGQGATKPEENNSRSEDNAEVNLAQNEHSSQKIKDGIIESIHKLWLSRKFTDLTVTVDKTEVRCHSFLLCACSNYFTGLLTDTHDKKITLDLCSKTTFETIVEALYSGKRVITLDNVIDVWHASHQLEISFMIDDCEEFVLKTLTVENFAEIHKHAILVGSTRVLQSTSKMIQENFEVFKECLVFLELSYNDLLKLVTAHDLVVASEDIVIDAILKWINYVPTQDRGVMHRKIHLGKLLTATRLSLVSPDCLKMLMECEIVLYHKEAREVVNKAIFYQLKVGQRHGQWPSSAIHRNNSEFENVAIAGCADGQISFMSLFGHQELHNFKPFSGFRNCHITVTVFDNTLYALASQRTCGQLYFLKDSEWQKIIDVPGTEQSLIAHGESIYFFQPIIKKVLKLDLPYKNTALVSLDDVPSDGTISSVISFERNILVFCQKPESLSELTTVHCLDTITEKWTRLNNLIGPAQLISVRDDNDTYILRNDGALSQIITTYSGRVDFKFIDKLWDFRWQLCGCVRLRNKVFICGSELEAEFPGNRQADSTGDQGEQKSKNHVRKTSMASVFDSIQYIDGKFDFFHPFILRKNVSLN